MQTQNTNQSETALHAIDYWQALKNRYGVILLTFLLVFLTAAVITYVMPKKYESAALVEVKPINDVNPVGAGVRGGSMGVPMTRQFMMTQFEIIVASETLGKAIDKIQLETRWGQDRNTVVETLRGIVQTKQKPGTDLIEISVRHRKKEEAQAIAKAVYEAYRDRRYDLEMNVRKDQLKAVKVELQNKSDRVAELRKRLMDIAEKVGVIWVESERGGQTIGGELELRQLAEKQLYEAERERDQLAFQINKLLAVEDEDLPAIAAELPDVGFKEAYNKYEEAKSELQTAKASGLGAKHPDIVMRETRIKELKKGLEKRAVNVRQSLKHRLSIIEGRVKKMQEVRDKNKMKARIKREPFRNLILQERNMRWLKALKIKCRLNMILKRPSCLSLQLILLSTKFHRLTIGLLALKFLYF